jgi:hypothetical protein
MFTQGTGERLTLEYVACSTSGEAGSPRLITVFAEDTSRLEQLTMKLSVPVEYALYARTNRLSLALIIGLSMGTGCP